MRARFAAAVTVAVMASLLVQPVPATAGKARGAMAVVALVDTGINPYSVAFRDNSPLARRHPSTYIPGYPKDARALRLSLGLPFEKAVKKDEKIWASVERSKLYWVPGTRIVGAISFGAGGTKCPSPTEVPPLAGFVQESCKEHAILDDQGHGSMTASRAAGSPNSLAPEARIVAIEGLGNNQVRWAADQGWIDVQSNSWLNLVPPPASSGSTGAAFRHASERMITMAASGNGTAYIMGVAPTPTYLLSTAAPGVILVGGHDNGKTALWSGAPPHVVADAYSGYTAVRRGAGKMQPDPIACCTSASAPYAAGGAAAIVQAAREILGDFSVGIKKGVIARGPKGVVPEGPLADGRFTLEEFKDVYLHTADPRPGEFEDDGDVHWAGEPRPPDNTQFGPGGNPFCLLCTTTPVPWRSIPEDPADAFYPFVGYGAIDQDSVKLAVSALLGKTQIPERPGADAQYQLDQQLREVLFP